VHQQLLQALVLAPELVVFLRQLRLLRNERLELAPDLLGEGVSALALAVALCLSTLQPEVLPLQALRLFRGRRKRGACAALALERQNLERGVCVVARLGQGCLTRCRAAMSTVAFRPAPW